MELFIRPAGPADAEAIAEVQRISWQEAYTGILRPESLDSVARSWDAGHWRASLERTDNRTIPLVLDSRQTGVAGFGVAGPRRGRRDSRLAELAGEIYLLYLLPGIQREGHGTALTAALARVLLARGMSSALVWALAANQSAIAFYRRMGGMVVAEARKPFFGEMVDEVALGWPDLETLIGISRKVGE